MRLCIIVGSNRRNGLSAQVCRLIETHMQGRAACDFVYLSEHEIQYCDADNKCQNRVCQLPDSVNEIAGSMLRADGIIYMPVMHAYGTNSRFQAFLERVGYGFFRPLKRPLRDKVAGVVVVGRRYGHTSVYTQIVLNVLLNKMLLIGSGFPTTFFGMLGKATHDQEAMESLADMLDRMEELHHKLEYAKVDATPMYA